MSLWISKRITRTQLPVVVAMNHLISQSKVDVLSLAQGQVHWTPPESVFSKVETVLRNPSTSKYGPDEGNNDLRDLLSQKINRKASILITQGANQAVFTALMATTDAKDSVGLLLPYYFNHHMACTALDLRVVCIPRTESMHPDVVRIEETVNKAKLKALVITNPCNPTGTVLSKKTLESIQHVCAKAKCALIVDNTYEDFVYTRLLPHEVVFGPTVFNVFSFSKSYGMAGWRMGYLTAPPSAMGALLKIQDTVVICPTQVSQYAALGALSCKDDKWVSSRVSALKKHEAYVRHSLESVCPVICGGEGSMFLFAQLPEALGDDGEVAQRLIESFGVAVLPGSACGMPGWIRVSFANLPFDKCQQAADRLRTGLESLNKGK